MDQLARRSFRQLSLTLGIVGLGGLVLNILAIPSLGFVPLVVSALIASAVFFGTNFIFFLVGHPSPWMQSVQALEIAAVGFVAAIVSEPDTYGGLIVVALAILLFAKHGLVKNRATLLVLLGGSIIVDAVASQVLHRAPTRLVLGMSAIAAGVFAVVYFAFYEEIISLLDDVSELRKTAEVAEQDLFKIRRKLARARVDLISARAKALTADARVRELEARVGGYQDVTSAVNLEMFGFSTREVDVLRNLVETRGRNRDIGKALGITERTVKSHIYRICNKVGVDTRLELVELFRWNWPQGEPVEEN